MTVELACQYRLHSIGTATRGPIHANNSSVRRSPVQTNNETCASAFGSFQVTIVPPPEGINPSEEEAVAVIHEWTLSHRFNVARKQLERNLEGGIVYRLFACDQRHRKTLENFVKKIGSDQIDDQCVLAVQCELKSLLLILGIQGTVADQIYKGR
ncbi:hypothetical protein F442_12041 [Phytophthora nicotianae P10297]|uniref:Uncharacterized protein n=1 Tax=Phytophthora nicotianae P10297 TaxID=1317064 RepID=W2Z374_PHYNI|nr:hypothetical protein F442_12041 [Phytophthora nicotianae P10297]